MTRRNLFKSILVAASLFYPVFSFAVTQKEMEQARVIAAKTYLRYANDGSGYLDDINPKTMEELQNALKTKEKENIKAFLAIAVPSDYASWDKQKLVDYWAGTAFQDKGLQEKGKGGRVRARSLLNKMEIASPSAAPAEPAKTAEPTKENTPAASTEEASAMAAADAGLPIEEATQPEVQSPAEDAVVEAAETEISDEPNYTWVYIMILAILVAVVLALVVYAANVFKKKGNESSPANEGEVYSHKEPDSEVIEKYEAAIADRDYEIAMLTKKLEAANRQNAELKSRLESRQKETPQSPKVNPSSLRTIFLGRANGKSIFVRADRQLNPGNSIFVLETGDGFSGSFKVADAPQAWDLALSNPEGYLMNACVGQDLEDTSGASRIVTEDPGTAIFEGGCWKVIRKAKIRYE